MGSFQHGCLASKFTLAPEQRVELDHFLISAVKAARLSRADASHAFPEERGKSRPAHSRASSREEQVKDDHASGISRKPRSSPATVKW